MSSNLSSNFLQFKFGMANGNGHRIYVFDEFRLDYAKLMLYREGHEVLLPPKVIKTLAILIENSGEILSKDELLERVWEGSIVEESNLSQCLYLLQDCFTAFLQNGAEILRTVFINSCQMFNGKLDGGQRIFHFMRNTPGHFSPCRKPVRTNDVRDVLYKQKSAVPATLRK